jgi:aminodeoxyfutalosine deaminase
MPVANVPKIELHVHLEGTVRPSSLIDIAAHNGVNLPADNEDDLAALYQFRDFEHFLDLWTMTTGVIRTESDFRKIVAGYAFEAASHGAVYIEGIFTPAERVQGGASWDEVFTGFCDGAEEAERTSGVIIRLTPDIPRNLGLEAAIETVRYSIRYQDRGIVGVGIGGPEATAPPELFAPAFKLAKYSGLGSVPHAGEVGGPESVWGAIRTLGADRIRHGIGAAEDPELLRELVERRIVCDVCPVSNLRTGVVPSLDAHPLPRLLASGVLCSISTDDPAMFGTDLTTEYRVATSIGTPPRMLIGPESRARCVTKTPAHCSGLLVSPSTGRGLSEIEYAAITACRPPQMARCYTDTGRDDDCRAAGQVGRVLGGLAEPQTGSAQTDSPAGCG